MKKRNQLSHSEVVKLVDWLKVQGPGETGTQMAKRATAELGFLVNDSNLRNMVRAAELVDKLFPEKEKTLEQRVIDLENRISALENDLYAPHQG